MHVKPIMGTTHSFVHTASSREKSSSSRVQVYCEQTQGVGRHRVKDRNQVNLDMVQLHMSSMGGVPKDSIVIKIILFVTTF